MVQIRTVALSVLPLSCTKPLIYSHEITYVLFVRWVNMVPVTLLCLLSCVGWGLRLSGCDDMAEFLFDLIGCTRTWCGDRFELNVPDSCWGETFFGCWWNLDRLLRLCDRRCVNLGEKWGWRLQYCCGSKNTGWHVNRGTTDSGTISSISAHSDVIKAGSKIIQPDACTSDAFGQYALLVCSNNWGVGTLQFWSIKTRKVRPKAVIGVWRILSH